MKKFTTQEVINKGVDLYDNKGFSRQFIWEWLKSLLDNGSAEFDLESVYDLIVG